MARKSSAKVGRDESEIIEGEVVESQCKNQIVLLPPMLSESSGLSTQSAAGSHSAIEELLSTIRSKNTWRNYQGDFRDFFCVFLGAAPTAKGYPDPNIVGQFLGQPRTQIALILSRYRAALLDRSLSESTIARRLAAVKSLLKFSYRLGWCETDGSGLIDVERVEQYRDTQGITPEITKKLLPLPAKLHGANTVHALRDEALIRLLSTNGLRRSSVCRADVDDFSLSTQRLSILRKGKGTQKKSVKLPARTADAIAAYLLASSHTSGPLFRNLHRNPAAQGRLTENGLWRILRTYGLHMGIDLRPHLFRHGAITALAKATNGNLLEVQEFSGHAKIETVRIYVRNAADTQGRMAELMDDLISGPDSQRRKRRR